MEAYCFIAKYFPSGGGQPEKGLKMKKINVLGINVKCHNKREESLICIIKRDINNFYRTFKNKPYSIADAYYMLFGQIESLYFMDLINYDNYKLMTDRLFNLYIFTREKANHK